MMKYDFNKVAMQLIEITLQYRCSPTSWLHIFRTHFHRNTPGRLLLVLLNHKIDNLNQILERCLWRGSYLVKLQALLKMSSFWTPALRNTFDGLFMKIFCTTHFTLAYMLKLFSHWIIVPSLLDVPLNEELKYILDRGTYEDSWEKHMFCCLHVLHVYPGGVKGKLWCLCG